MLRFSSEEENISAALNLGLKLKPKTGLFLKKPALSELEEEVSRVRPHPLSIKKIKVGRSKAKIEREKNVEIEI